MARLVDADALLHTHKLEQEAIGKDWGVDDLATAIMVAPTIDAIPVEWLEDKMFNSTKEVSVSAWRVLNEWHPHDAQAWRKEQEEHGI